MKLAENIMVFSICLSFALYVVSNIGLGGDRIADMQNWELLVSLFALGILVAIAAVVLALALSGSQASVIGSGVTLGNRLGEAAVIGVWSGFYVPLVAYASLTFYGIDYVGWIIGGIFGVAAIIAFIKDLYDKIMPGGR